MYLLSPKLMDMELSSRSWNTSVLFPDILHIIYFTNEVAEETSSKAIYRGPHRCCMRLYTFFFLNIVWISTFIESAWNWDRLWYPNLKIVGRDYFFDLFYKYKLNTELLVEVMVEGLFILQLNLKTLIRGCWRECS